MKPFGAVDDSGGARRSGVLLSDFCKCERASCLRPRYLQLASWKALSVHYSTRRQGTPSCGPRKKPRLRGQRLLLPPSTNRRRQAADILPAERGVPGFGPRSPLGAASSLRRACRAALALPLCVVDLGKWHGAERATCGVENSRHITLHIHRTTFCLCFLRGGYLVVLATYL